MTTDEELIYIAESLFGYEKPIHKSAPMGETLWNPFDEIISKKEKNGYLFSRSCRRSGPLYSNSDLTPLSNLLLVEKLKERKLK